MQKDVIVACPAMPVVSRLLVGIIVPVLDNSAKLRCRLDSIL